MTNRFIYTLQEDSEDMTFSPTAFSSFYNLKQHLAQEINFLKKDLLGFEVTGSIEDIEQRVEGLGEAELEGYCPYDYNEWRVWTISKLTLDEGVKSKDQTTPKS